MHGIGLEKHLKHSLTQTFFQSKLLKPIKAKTATDFLQDEYLQATGTSIDLGLFDLIERCEEEALNGQRSTSALCKIIGL